MTTDNVIKFRPRKTETVEIQEEQDSNREALEFAYEVLDILHDMLHEQTGDCIYTDRDYSALTICVAEVIAAVYLTSQGIEHPFQEIANDFFGNVDVDIDSEMDYNESNINDEDT
jgi:hypothetical protein